MLKQIVAVALSALIAVPAIAQNDFKFTTVKELPLTNVKNQYRSSTCWCFSTLSYFEAELLRLGKGEYDFSEAFVVNKTMVDRAEKAVRTHGDVSFSPGGFASDVAYCWKHYGIIPQDAMPTMGSIQGDTLPNNSELDAVAEAYVKAIVDGEKDRPKLSPVWKQGLQAIYDNYLGKCPEKFTYKGKEYTPKSFAESLPINIDDYVSITSFTHHPFYEPFVIEVQDNWRWEMAYNVTIDEMMKIIDNALDKGFPIAWGTDVSEQGFSRQGIGQVPDVNSSEMLGSDMARWTGLSTTTEKRDFLTSKPLPEITVTQELRQQGYDNWETTDDHGMLIFGIAKDQNGKPYYMARNSWGTDNPYKGTWYFTKAFVALKTIDIMVHKDAIPSDLAKKLGIKK
ncbi:MAG: C1 family peptidase [Bacteroidales bacterium]|nr:C1 family peptidase [Bacteroidales bacterium]